MTGHKDTGVCVNRLHSKLSWHQEEKKKNKQKSYYARQRWIVRGLVKTS